MEHKERTIVDSGQPMARLVSWESSGEIATTAIEILQGLFEERAGVRLPHDRMEGGRAELPDKGQQQHLLVGTLAQMQDFAPAAERVRETRDKIGAEGFYLGFSNGGVHAALTVIGADERGLLYGIGQLLRAMQFRGRDVAADITEMWTTPTFAIRGHLLANHIWSPQYDLWDEETYDRYLADLALWGVNTILTTPYHPCEWATCQPFADTPVFHDEKVRAAWEFNWRVQQAIPGLARKYGMRFGLWIPPNDIPVDEAVPPMKRPDGRDPDKRALGPLAAALGRCDNVCPSQPEMRARILYHRDVVFRALDPLDIVIVPSADCGGCACEVCAPWTQTYMALCEEMCGILHRYHPDAWFGISNQFIASEEDTWLLNHLKTERPSWLRFIVHAPGSSDLARMRKAVPSEYQIFSYEDTTHMAANPGYLVEDVPIHPLIQQVYQQAHLEATPFARPEALTRVYPRHAEHTQGSFPYSEGAHDDLTKVIWSQLDWDPTRDVAAMVKAYNRFHFGETGADKLTEVWYRLERALTQSPIENPEIEETLARMESARGQLPGWALQNWRWKMLEVRVLLDRFLQLYQRMGKRIEEALTACLSMEQPERPVRDLATRIREAGPRPVLDDLRTDLGAMFPYFPSAEIARRERKEYGERPSHPLTNALDSWTDDLREMELLDHRIQALSWELRKAIGLELRAAWIIRGRKTPYDWCLDSLEALACSPDSAHAVQREIARALKPEESGPGGAYDELGHGQKQPHLKAGYSGENCFADIFLGERMPAETFAVSPWGEDLVLSYEGLRSDVAYEVRVTYIQARHEFRKQILIAVSSQEALPLHSSLLLPTRPMRYSFTLPAGFIPDGKLDLRFRRVEGRPCNAVASEVWLSPLAE